MIPFHGKCPDSKSIAVGRLLLGVLASMSAWPLATCSHGYSGTDCSSPLAAQSTEECNANVRRGGAGH
jgi:hypothetical protein